jgi:hypothetical protein
MYSYKWSVDGVSVYRPDSRTPQEQQFVSCARGAFPSLAKFYLRPDDAFAFDDGEKTIICDVFLDGIIEKTVHWQGYIPVHREEIDETGVVCVTFKDKRLRLEQSAIHRKYNSVFLMTYTATNTEYIYYDEEYCKPSNSPYSWQEVIDELFEAASMPTVILPFTPEEVPRNILFCGSVAECIQRLLCSIGCELVYKPFSGQMEILKLSDTGDTTPVDDAIAEGRLVYKNEIVDTQSIGKAVIWPADWYPIRQVVHKDLTIGTGKEAIDIHDYQLADETTKKVRDWRETEIQNALDGWFRADEDIRDETLYGVIEQEPNEDMTEVTRLLPTPQPTKGLQPGDQRHGHLTRVRNYVKPLTWQIRVEHFYPPFIRGRTLAGGLTADTVGFVMYTKSIEGGAFADTVHRVKAISILTPILENSTLAIWAAEHKWTVARVC